MIVDFFGHFSDQLPQILSEISLDRTVAFNEINERQQEKNCLKDRKIFLDCIELKP